MTFCGSLLRVTFIDRETGAMATSTEPMSEFWWTEGNGSCDCNRAYVFGVEDDVMKCQSKRFLAVDVEGDLGEMTKVEMLAAMNGDYVDATTYRKLVAQDDRLRKRIKVRYVRST